MTLPKTNNINHTLWQTSDLKCGTDLSPGLVILAVFHQDRTINMENVHTETGLCRLKLARHPMLVVIQNTVHCKKHGMAVSYDICMIC